MEILTFTPLYKSVLWGGDGIARFKGITPVGHDVGESWELSPMEGSESVVDRGEHRGTGLNRLVELYGGELMGPRLMERCQGRFPLLVKIIDARRDLSIQVHPGDEMARRRHGCQGKTETWLSLYASRGASLLAGLTQQLTEQELRRRAADSTLAQVLRSYAPEPGDVFFLPAGRIHAIGAGNLVLEVQQASDVTYRINDYGRRDKEGNLRQLHLEQAVEAVDYDDWRPAATHVRAVAGQETEMVCDPRFRLTLVGVDTQMVLDLRGRDSFTILFAARGSVVVEDGRGSRVELTRGRTALVPASTPWVRMQGSGQVVTCHVP